MEERIEFENLKKNKIAVAIKDFSHLYVFFGENIIKAFEKDYVVFYDRLEKEFGLCKKSCAIKAGYKIFNFDQIDFEEDKLKFKGGSEIIFDKKTGIIKGFSKKACCDPVFSIKKDCCVENTRKTQELKNMPKPPKGIEMFMMSCSENKEQDGFPIKKPLDDYNLKRTEKKKYELELNGKTVEIVFKKFCEVGKCTLWKFISCKFTVGGKELYNFDDWVMLGKISNIIQNTMDELNGV